jgi:hypothetical protein
MSPHIVNKPYRSLFLRSNATAQQLSLMSSPEGASSASWTTLRDAIPVFDGTNSAITQKWLDDIEAVFASHPHHLGFRTAAARAKLSGAAAAVMADYIGRDWPEFKVRLLRRFDPEHARVAIQLELSCNHRYVSGSFMAALDKAVADFQFLGPAFAVSILRCLALRVPCAILDSIGYSPADDFYATIALFRETAKKAQLRADRHSAWATTSETMALTATAGPRDVTKAKPVKTTSDKTKAMRRRTRLKDRLDRSEEQVRALTAQLQNARLGADEDHLFP